MGWVTILEATVVELRMSFLAYKLKLSLHGKKVILYSHFEHYIMTFLIC